MQIKLQTLYFKNFRYDQRKNYAEAEANAIGTEYAACSRTTPRRKGPLGHHLMLSAAWALMGLVAIVCNIMIGHGACNAKSLHYLLFVLPLIVATSFFLIADIDSPREMSIRFKPQNLLSLLESLPQPEPRSAGHAAPGTRRRPHRPARRKVRSRSLRGLSNT